MKTRIQPNSRPALAIQEIASALREVGVRSNDTVMVHSAFSSISPVVDGAEGFIKALEIAAGPDPTIVMPTFNWDILSTNCEITFDVRNTPSKMGYLTEYFRTRRATHRTENLFNPLAYRGRHSQRISEYAHGSTWGSDSPFELLYEQNAAIILVGVDYSAVTMLHIAEVRARVPYRFWYEFPNAFVINTSGEYRRVFQKTFKKLPGYISRLNNAANVIDTYNLASTVKLRSGNLTLLRARELVDRLKQRLASDPHLLVTKSDE